MAASSDTDRHPPIEDYSFISDCHSVALVSRTGSVDWACMPRLDHGSIFGRLLDWELGGYCSISPTAGEYHVSRRYLDQTLVLETTFDTGDGRARLIDCFTMVEGGARHPYQQLLRIIEGESGQVDLVLRIAPRFDYGQMHPWIRCHSEGHFTAIGGDDGLIIWSDCPLTLDGRHDLTVRFSVEAGARHYLSMQHRRPELIDPSPPPPPSTEELDQGLDKTVELWRRWCLDRTEPETIDPPVMRSALVLKALNYAPTGAIAAAATTSLPEAAGGSLNWDYRFSWIRDSWLTVRALGKIGPRREADSFRRFIQRSTAGQVDELQVMYGIHGERRLTEFTLDHLDGYRGARPVRIGNAATGQLQLDMYGGLLELAWRWTQEGHTPDEDYWIFLTEVVGLVAARWSEPDHGIWEIRGIPRHFVFSKIMCWAALDRGIKLVERFGREAPLERWIEARDAVRQAIETRGYDRNRRTFVQTLGEFSLDAALLLAPSFDFVAYDDERMIGTADAIIADLDRGGLILRNHDLPGDNPFLACTFWLTECLARQGRMDQAGAYFNRAMDTANDLGLFSEEYDVEHRTQLGNFPQALTHLAHIGAALALGEMGT